MCQNPGGIYSNVVRIFEVQNKTPPGIRRGWVRSLSAIRFSGHFQQQDL